MIPAAAVSGIYLAHPRARYFAVGRIGDDQLADYAARKGVPVVQVETVVAAKSLVAAALIGLIIHGSGARRRPHRQDLERRPGEGHRGAAAARRPRCRAGSEGRSRRARSRRPTAPASARRSRISSSPGTPTRATSSSSSASSSTRTCRSSSRRRRFRPTSRARSRRSSAAASSYQLGKLAARRPTSRSRASRFRRPDRSAPSSARSSTVQDGEGAGAVLVSDYVFFGAGRTEYEFTVIAPVGVARPARRASSSGSPRSCCGAPEVQPA